MILFLTRDLMFLAKISSLARTQGGEVAAISSGPSLVEEARVKQPRLVLLDLTVAGLDITALVPALRAAAPQAKLVAFGPHVQETELALARQAGCDEVLPRSQFDKQVASVLARFAAV